MLRLLFGKYNFPAGLLQAGLRLLSGGRAKVKSPGTAGRLRRRHRPSREEPMALFDGCGGFMPLPAGSAYADIPRFCDSPSGISAAVEASPRRSPK